MKLRTQCDKVHRTIDPFVARMRQLTHKQREMVTELMFQAQEMEARLSEIETEIRARVKLAGELARKEIRVLKRICPQVTLRIAGQVLAVDKPVTGPVNVRLDEATRRVVIQP